jgi:hypothetical protein
MNLNESPDGHDRPAATQRGTSNSSDDREPRAAQFSGGLPRKCLICGDPIGDRCFCKLHRKENGPVMLCCPSCVIQYLDATRPPADPAEEELRAYEENTHFFIGEDKPWS